VEWGINLKLTKSIRFHIWLNFIFFVLCVTVLLWIFQIAFLQNFYEKLRTNTIEETAHSMTRSYSQTNTADEKSFNSLMDQFDSTAIENDFTYIITDSTISYIKHCNDQSVINNSFHLREQLDLLARNSILKNGYFITSEQGPTANSEALVICTVLKDKNGKTDSYLMINSIITPVNSTIVILKQNTYWITTILIIIALVLSFFISKSIIRPILKITKSADRLGKGEYNVEFDGGRFNETQQLAKTLNYASSEISKVDELQRDLIANVSHDLRTPLTMIKAYAEMIRDLSGPKKEKREEHLRIIIDETDRLALLVNDMLDLSKLEKGGQPLNYTSFDINSKLHDIITRYKGISNVMGYTINFKDDTPVIVKCDIVKIEQVIYNLINNAINYTGDDKQVYVTQTIEDDFVKITISDTGKGISEDNIHQIFDKYYRCEKTRREVIGTGLGLSIVKAILKKHNFPFGVQSTVGIGTSFWFKIKRDNETICPK